MWHSGLQWLPVVNASCKIGAHGRAVALMAIWTLMGTLCLHPLRTGRPCPGRGVPPVALADSSASLRYVTWPLGEGAASQWTWQQTLTLPWAAVVLVQWKTQRHQTLDRFRHRLRSLPRGLPWWTARSVVAVDVLGHWTRRVCLT